MRWPKGSEGRADDGSFFVVQTDEGGPFELHGELDMDTLAVLDELPLATPSGQPVVLDLEGLTFVDSSGMRGLLELRRRVIDLGGPVARSPGPPSGLGWQGPPGRLSGGDWSARTGRANPMGDAQDEVLDERLTELSELVRECQAGLRVVTVSDVEAAIVALGSRFEGD